MKYTLGEISVTKLSDGTFDVDAPVELSPESEHAAIMEWYAREEAHLEEIADGLRERIREQEGATRGS